MTVHRNKISWLALIIFSWIEFRLKKCHYRKWKNTVVDILEINDVFSLLTSVKFANVETRKKRTFQINGSNLFCFLLNDWISSPVISVRCGSWLENKIFRYFPSSLFGERGMISPLLCWCHRDKTIKLFN